MNVKFRKVCFLLRVFIVFKYINSREVIYLVCLVFCKVFKRLLFCKGYGKFGGGRMLKGFIKVLN